MGKLRKAYFMVGVIAIAIMASTCGNKKGEDQEEVVYRLKWIFNASVAGDIYADVQGMFSDQGLDVTVRQGGPERDAIKEVELGHAQFGVASADQVIRARAKGSPVVVIAQIFQTNPLQWVYRPDDIQIKNPDDFKGKTIGITYGGNDETIMRAILKRYDISEDEVRLFSVRYDYTPFYERKVDLWPVYRNTQGVFISKKLRSAGEQVQFFDPHIAGIRFVANSVITSEHILKSHPQTVQKFVTALIQGWEASLDPKNEANAVAAIHQFDKDTSVDIIKEQLAVTRALVRPSRHSKIGTIDTEAWKQTERIMLDQKLISRPAFVEKILKGKD